MQTLGFTYEVAEEDFGFSGSFFISSKQELEECIRELKALGVLTKKMLEELTTTWKQYIFDWCAYNYAVDFESEVVEHLLFNQINYKIEEYRLNNADFSAAAWEI